MTLSVALRDCRQMIQRPALRGTIVRISLAAFIEEGLGVLTGHEGRYKAVTEEASSLAETVTYYVDMCK